MKSKLELIQEAQSILSSLFEVEDNADTSTNKLRREKKGKNGEEVVVTSVQDELFPYEGNAKEQFNKKVIATINDMIEGKATLEDLIQLVRKGPRRTAHESLSEEIINEISDKLKRNAQRKMKHIRDIALIKHGLTMNPENPDGDPELAKERQDAVERDKKFDKAILTHNEFKYKKEKEQKNG